MGAMLSRFAHPGLIQWIGVRPARREPMTTLQTVALTENGLAGDRRQSPGKRAVSLLQAEHLPVINALAPEGAEPSDLRRNLLISGINLLSLRKVEFRIGGAILRGTGICAPCSRMEETLGPGGYNAVRGHGGITAEVVQPGTISIGDAVQPITVL